MSYVPPHLRNAAAAANVAQTSAVPSVPSMPPAAASRGRPVRAAGPVRAGGLVVYRRFGLEQVIQYLLVQSATGARGWTPPKGVAHSNEGFLEAAVRETEEETGLTPVQLRLLSNEPVMKPIIYYDSKIRSDKTSVYYVAELLEPNATINIGADRPGNMEIADYAWLPIVEAKERMQYKEMSDLLDAAEAAIHASA